MNGRQFASTSALSATAAASSALRVRLFKWADPVTFSYTGAEETFVVPPTVGWLEVHVWGAGGGGGLGGLGGPGAMVQGRLAVTPNETLRVLVGQAGDGFAANQAGSTFGGGGGGIAGDALFNSRGGGRSCLRRNLGTTMSPNWQDVVTAGAGGGGRNGTGGFGGLVTGGGTTWPRVATGGTQTAGGNTGGGLYFGGNAVQNNNGGGGSGLYGGGGSPGQDGAGAGGSSLTANLSLIPGQTVLGFESPNGTHAPATTNPYYGNNAGAGGAAGTGSTRGGQGGHGRIVLRYLVPA